MRPALRAALAAALLMSNAWGAGADTPPAWRQAIGGTILGKPAAQAESVVVACDDRSIRNYGRSGAFLWRFDAEGRIGPHIARSPEGTSYLGRTDLWFIAVNRSGRELWRRRLDAPLAGPALSGYDGRVFAATERSIYCFSVAGVLKWKRPLGAEATTEARLSAEGGVLIGLADGTVLRAGPFGTIARLGVSSPPTAVADAADGDGARAVAALADGRLVAEDPQSGSARLLASLGSPAAALAVRDGKLGFLLREGRVGMIDFSSAELLWTGQAPASREWTLRFDERGLYALGDGGAAGFAADGRRLWNLRIAGAAAPPALSDEGMLYSGGSDWILYAYRVEERVRTRADSPYAPRPEGSYGLAEASAEDADPLYENPFAREEAFIETTLGQVERALADEEVGEEEEAFARLLYGIAGSERAPIKSRTPSVLPHHRARAAGLIGRLGSRESIPFLIEVFRRDPETVVRAAAAEAIGAIGSDPDGGAMDAFAQAVFPPQPIREERLLIAVASSIGALCRFSGPPLSEQGIRVLVALSSADRPAVVRKRARAEMESFAALDFMRK